MLTFEEKSNTSKPCSSEDEQNINNFPLNERPISAYGNQICNSSDTAKASDNYKIVNNNEQTKENLNFDETGPLEKRNSNLRKNDGNLKRSSQNVENFFDKENIAVKTRNRKLFENRTNNE